MRIFRASLMAASAVTCLAASQALAQNAETPPSQPTEAAGETAQSAEAENATGSSDIIVTARRRAESITDVPISITALGAESLETRKIERVDDLTRSVPSLKMNATAGRRSNSQYEIRGINVVESLVTADPPVGVYVNDVFRARATGTNQSFFDIENVQVLYGPQGTLFGRSATAGAVLINTKTPTNHLEGSIEVGYGRFNRLETTAVLNVPITDGLAIRFAGQRVKQDGFARNVTSGQRLGNIDNWSGRISVLLKPTDSIENILVGSLYSANESGSAIFLRNIRPCPPAGVTPRPVLTCNFAATVAAAFAAQNAMGPYKVALDPTLFDWRGIDEKIMPGLAGRHTNPYERPRNYSLTNTTTIELSDQIKLKNIFGYNISKYLASTDLDATPVKYLDVWYDQHVKTLSNELQLQGETGGLDWVVGGIYFRERGVDIQNSIQVISNYSTQSLTAINKSYALFAQGTYKFTPEFSVTAGGRYSWDDRTAIYGPSLTQTGVGSATPGTPFCSLATDRDETGAPIDPDGDCLATLNKVFKQPTYTLSVDYKPRRGLLFYAATRRGYRSGGFQARVVPNITLLPYNSETVKDVEIGYKGDYNLGGDARLRSSIALYKSWWNDLQRSTTVPIPNPPFTTTAVANAAKADIKGFEAALGITPMRGITVDGYVGYVDGVYRSFSTAVATLKNFPFPTSKWTGGVTAVLTPIDRAEIGTVNLVGDLSFRSHYFADQSLPLVEPESRVPAQTFINLSAQWEHIAGSDFTAQLWMRNVTNKLRIVGQTTLAGSLGIIPAVIGEPRTYGFTLKYQFGR